MPVLPKIYSLSAQIPAHTSLCDVHTDWLREVFPYFHSFHLAGRAIAQREVTEVILDNGVAVGVKARKSHNPEAEVESYYAPIIISDAGAFNTYTKLIRDSKVLTYQEQIKAFPKGYSAITLYLGLKESPEKLGFRGENHWIYSHYNHDMTFAHPTNADTQTPTSCYLSFPSLKNSEAQAHTAEVIVFAEYDFFSKWKHNPWRRRGPEYTALKENLSENILNLVEAHYPGFKELVAYQELSTPLTVEYFDASDRGSIYGIPNIPERLKQPWISSKTPICNLYLTGSDSFLFAIMGAMMGGVKTAGIINGPFGFFKIMSTIMRSASGRKAPEPER